MELNDIFTDPSTIQLLATIAAAVILAGITAIVTAYSTHKVVGYLKMAWLNVRSKIDVVIEAIDEETDPANVEIDKVLDRIAPANWNQYSAVFLPVLLRALADGLDTITAPPQEVNITAPEVDIAQVAKRFEAQPK